MAYPKMKQCPKCGSLDLSVYTYESGWSRVECSECDHISSCESTVRAAIKTHNARSERVRDAAPAMLKALEAALADCSLSKQAIEIVEAAISLAAPVSSRASNDDDRA